MLDYVYLIFSWSFKILNCIYMDVIQIVEGIMENLFENMQFFNNNFFFFLKLNTDKD